MATPPTVPSHRIERHVLMLHCACAPRMQDPVTALMTATVRGPHMANEGRIDRGETLVPNRDNVELNRAKSIWGCSLMLSVLGSRHCEGVIHKWRIGDLWLDKASPVTWEGLEGLEGLRWIMSRLTTHHPKFLSPIPGEKSQKIEVHRAIPYIRNTLAS